MLDIQLCNDFYQSPNGNALQFVIRHEIMHFLPNNSIKNGLLLGYGDGFINDNHFENPPIFAYSELMGAKTNVYNDENYSCLVNPYQLPFTNEQFDFIFSIHCYDQLEKIDDALAETNRVAMQGATLITIFNNTAGIWLRMGNSPFADSFVYDNVSFSKKLQHSGWQVQHIQFFGFSSAQKFHTKFAIALEKLGRKYLPYLGGLNMIIARKINLAPKRIKAQYNLLWDKKTTLSHAPANRS